MILTVARTLRAWFSPTIDALFARNLLFSYRWRLLALQPISLLTYSIASIPWIFSRTFRTEDLPISPDRTLRVLDFDNPQPKKPQVLSTSTSTAVLSSADFPKPMLLLRPPRT